MISETKYDMENWKKIWGDILSDPDFRNWMTKSGYYEFYPVINKRDKNYKFTLTDGDVWAIKDGTTENSEKPSRKYDTGTLYLEFGDLAHFVAYELVNKKTIKIFDPSHSFDGIRGTYSTELKHFHKFINSYFDRRIIFEKQYGTPQRHLEDTFCQTWSLAFLCASLCKTREKDKCPSQNMHEALLSSIDDEVVGLFNVCKAFIESDVFHEICTEQRDWILEESINKHEDEDELPEKWTPEYFYTFCQGLTIEDFRLLLPEEED